MLRNSSGSSGLLVNMMGRWKCHWFLSLALLLLTIEQRIYGQDIRRNGKEHEIRSEMINLLALEDNTIGGGVVGALHSLLTLLKSSSFPTAVANISNQQCVSDSIAYVHSLYNPKPTTRWARQSKLLSFIIL